MKRSDRILLALIAPFRAQYTMGLSQNDLSEIKSAALRHNLLMLLYTRLKKYAAENPVQPEATDFLKSLENIYKQNAIQSMRHEALENKSIAILESCGIPAIVIKGNALAKEIYEDANCRTSSDIDLLIKFDDVLRADAALLKSGYLRSENSSLNFWMERLHHAVYCHSATGIIVEVHWNLGIPAIFDLSSEDIWKDVIHINGTPKKLSPEMTLIHLLTHHFFGHSFREFRILVDILWALDRYRNVIEWREFAARLNRIGLVRATHIALNQIESLWGNLDTVIPSIASLREAIGPFGRESSALIESHFKIDLNCEKILNQKIDKIAIRFALDRHRTIIYSFIKILIPPIRAIKNFYAEESNWMLPFNYLRFITWRTKQWIKK